MFTKNLCCVWLVCAGYAAHAQSTSFLPLTKLETKDGLSSPNVRKIIQDKYGFMWFATQDGLNRYDGTQFTRFIAGATEQHLAILESDVYDLALDETGDYLWCLTAYGGLSKIDLAKNHVVDTFSLVKHPDTRANLWYKSMSLCKGSIYIGTDEGLLIKFDVNHSRVDRIFDIHQRFKNSQHIDKIFIDSLKRLWIMSSNAGIFVTDTTLSNSLAFFSGNALGTTSNSFQFRDFAVSGDHLLVCSSAGLSTLSVPALSVQPLNSVSPFLGAAITQGDLYSVSVNGDQVLITGNNRLYAINKQTKLVRDIVFSKNYEDWKWLTVTGSIFQSGPTIWIGSQYGVAWIKNINTAFTGYYNSMNGNDTEIQHSITLCNPTDSTLVVCGDDGLYFANHITGAIKKFPVIDFYYHAFKAPDNYMIASGFTKGLQLIDPSGKPAALAAIFPELKTIQQDVLISSTTLNDSLYFLASQNQKGVYIWNTHQRTLRVLSVESRPVNRVYLDSQQTLWIICDNAVFIYNYLTGQLENLNLVNPATNQSLSINMDLCEFSNRFWIASYGTGIIELDQQKKLRKIYGLRDGINNLGLYKIFRLNDSMLMVSSNNGLSALDIKSGKVLNYFEGDGLQSNNFEETSGCENKNFLFFGGIRGYTKIEKKRFFIDTDFYTTYFSSIQIQLSNEVRNISGLLVQKIEIPSDVIQTVINFSVLNFLNTERLKFEYSIPELGDKWSQVEQRFVSLAGISPGKYTLKIRTSNEYGEWSPPIELAMVFLPKWYQTWWFKALLALAFIGIVYTFYRMRIAQLGREEAIRRKLASDLHDDLGSTLNSVKVYANLAILEKQNDTHLSRIKESIQDAIVSIRDMIWVLDDKKDTVDHLAGRVLQFAEPLCDANGIVLEKEISETAYDHILQKEERRNLYMIIKETINNSIKYASCKKIRLSILQESGRLRIRISDDGTGFNKTTISEGNGMRNIDARAKEAGYRAIITSAPGQGTTVELVHT